MAEELFCKLLSVVIKCRDCEDRRATIRLTVETYSTSNPVHKKDLVVRLSDDADPFFLYNLTLGEEDFQSLKNQQGLLVEFSAFPQRFIDLLDQCLSEQEKQVPRFLLQLITSSSALDCTSPTLNVIETNPFKHLTHLSLKLLAGSDSDVKKYLAACIKLLKSENSILEEKLQRSEEELSKRLSLTQQALADKTKELDKLRNEWTSQSSLLANRHAQELAAERSKALQIQAQYQLQYEKHTNDRETASSRTTQLLDARVSELETANKDLTERKYKSESCIRELKSKLSGLEEEYQRTKQEVSSLRRENSTLDSECHEREKLVNQLKTRTAVLEQEVKDKEQVVIKANGICESAQEHKKRLEETLEQKQLQTGKLETTVKSLSEELLKANEIIKKLQGDMKKLMEKIKLKNTVTMQQEKLLGEKEQALQKETFELSNVKQALNQKVEEALKIQEQLDKTVEKLEESKQLLKTNENVISWLNKQLNENKIASLQGTGGQSEVQSSVKSGPIASNLTGMQNGLVRFNLSSNTVGSPSLDSRLIPTTSTPLAAPTSEHVDRPGLDMKYLNKNCGIPIRAPNPSNGPGTVPSRPTLSRQGSLPTMSAYFPGQQPRLPAS
ncbi:spindle assembly abnormal protein 6 homolog [Ambystoma mexicanum]|uniref:spindle assembly abnormal protein 6 homolog n=1 Tax=Ambystoma mexicanum TaxID=8296 RepID=UPI0037E78361